MSSSPLPVDRDRGAAPASSAPRVRRVLSPVTIGVTVLALAACGSERDRAFEDALRADLALAAGAPSLRQAYVGPAELGYPPGYGPAYRAPGYGASAYGSPAYGYPAPGYPPAGYPAPGYPAGAVPAVAYPAPAPPTRVVYRTPTAGGGASGTGAAGSASGSGAGGVVTENNTKRGAIIGGATGAAVGIMTSRDKVKGGAVGAITGAVLGGVVGSQIYTQPRSQRRN